MAVGAAWGLDLCVTLAVSVSTLGQGIPAVCPHPSHISSLSSTRWEKGFSGMVAVSQGMPFITAGRVDEVVLELERQRRCMAPLLSFRCERCRPQRLTAVWNCPNQSNEKYYFSPQILPHSNASLRMSNNCHYSSVSTHWEDFKHSSGQWSPKSMRSWQYYLPFPSTLPCTMQTELNVIWAPDICKNTQWRDQKMSPGGGDQVKKGENAWGRM